MQEHPGLHTALRQTPPYCCYSLLFITHDRSFRTRDWSNISKLVKKHVCEESAHHTAVARREAFLHTQRGGAPNIYQELHSQRAEQVRRNRNIFKCITEVLRSYDGEAKHSYQRSPRRRWQFYGDAVSICERKLSSAWSPRKCTSDFQIYMSGYPEHHIFFSKADSRWYNWQLQDLSFMH